MSASSSYDDLCVGVLSWCIWRSKWMLRLGVAMFGPYQITVAQFYVGVLWLDIRFGSCSFIMPSGLLVSLLWLLINSRLESRNLLLFEIMSTGLEGCFLSKAFVAFVCACWKLSNDLCEHLLVKVWTLLLRAPISSVAISCCSSVVFAHRGWCIMLLDNK